MPYSLTPMVKWSRPKICYKLDLNPFSSSTDKSNDLYSPCARCRIKCHAHSFKRCPLLANASKCMLISLIVINNAIVDHVFCRGVCMENHAASLLFSGGRFTFSRSRWFIYLYMRRRRSLLARITLQEKSVPITHIKCCKQAALWALIVLCLP